MFIKIMKDAYVTRKTLLMRACNQDDEKAWEDFVYYYESFIQMVISQLLIDKSYTDDLRQDILVKLWKKLKSYDESKSKFRTWLSRVIRNTVINFIRDNAKERNLLTPETESLLDPESENELNDHIQSEWETYVTNLALERIKPLFSDNALKVFNMVLDNESVNDIADKLDLSQDSVYKMKTRTVKRLKEEVKIIRADTEF